MEIAAMGHSRADCALCEAEGGAPLWSDDFLRVVAVEDERYAGFCRVIVNRHVVEMSELNQAERGRVMAAVFAVEAALRELMKPDKINLASLGNQTAHVHWHIVPRYRDDAHFPAAIWGPPARVAPKRPDPDWSALRARLAILETE
jgi:diadenosine tetraphosphate (Ap4A) HIT family hydrolase